MVAYPAEDTSPQTEVRLVTTRAQLRDTLAFVQSLDTVGLDCEADGKNPMTAVPLLVQVGNAERVDDIVLGQFSERELALLWKLLPGRTIVGQNIGYDYKLLRNHYQIPQWTGVYDTLLCEALLTQGDYESKTDWLPAISLKALAAKYLGLDLDKTVRASFIGVSALPTFNPRTWLPDASQTRYAALDVVISMQVAERQYEVLAGENLLRAASTRLAALVPFAEVELRGMRIDVDAWRRFLALIQDEATTTEERLVTLLDGQEQQRRVALYRQEDAALKAWQERYDYFINDTRYWYDTKGSDRYPVQEGETYGRYKTRIGQEFRAQDPRPKKPVYDPTPINLGSPKQVLHAYQARGLHVEHTDKTVRSKLLLEPLTPEQREMVQTHNDWSALNRILVGFGENILAQINPVTGRLHTSFNIGLTVTGRASSNNPNFQNMPKRNEIRNAFIADPGYLIVTADFKSQELVIAAGMSGDERMKAHLRAGRDLYKELAVRVFGCAYEAVTKDQRQMCKSGLLGVCYGLTAIGMERIHRIQQDVGEQIIQEIKTAYPTFFGFAGKNSKMAWEQRVVRTALGAKRYFRDTSTPRWKIENEGRNAPIQGTAADIVYTVARRMEALTAEDIWPLNYVHDEVVSKVPEASAEAARDRIVAEMQAAFWEVMPFSEYGVLCEVETQIAPYWSK